MLKYQTLGFSGCAVAYSPFLDDRIAVGASANYGLAGNGRLYVLDITPAAEVRCFRTIDTSDGITSVAWSEQHAAQIAVGCGDGLVRLFDTAVEPGLPVQVFRGHGRDVFSVSWGQVDKSMLCSGAWDGSIRIWTPELANAIQEFQDLGVKHRGPSADASAVAGPAVYCVEYAPSSATEILSAHAGGAVRLWDVRAHTNQLVLPAVRGGDCLSVARNKYDSFRIATAGTDSLVRSWDLRNVSVPVCVLQGHQLAVKSVSWSPHSERHLLSTSYDMTAKVWVDRGAVFAPQTTAASPSPLPPLPPQSAPLAASRSIAYNFTAHTEFVTGGAWSLWGQPGWAATVGWDQMLYIWRGFS